MLAAQAVLLVRVRGSEVRRKVDDQLAVDNQVIVRLLQVAREHLC